MNDVKNSNWESPRNWDGSNSWESQPTNIILNAVAPELLEALQRSTALLEWESKWSMGDDLANHERSIVIQLSKKAIAKATGEQK
jgi:hypothetical protein